MINKLENGCYLAGIFQIFDLLGSCPFEEMMHLLVKMSKSLTSYLRPYSGPFMLGRNYIYIYIYASKLKP
jgi:hypothetical protein